MTTTHKRAGDMTQAEKVASLIEIAERLAPTLPGGDDLWRRATHLACSVYRNRHGRLPTRNIIDQVASMKRPTSELEEVIIQMQEIGRYNQLREEGYQCRWSGNGLICMVRPKNWQAITAA